MIGLVWEQLPRLVAAAFSVHSLLLLVTRWQVTRVMTQERRFLFAFFILQCSNSTMSAVTKAVHHVPLDVSSWGSALTQSLLCAYVYYAIPPEFRRWHHRFSRRKS